MKHAALAYLAAILVVGGLVTALTAPKKAEEEKKAKEHAAAVARAKQPPAEMAPIQEIASRVEQIRGLDFEGGTPKLEIALGPELDQALTKLDSEVKPGVLETAGGIVLAQAGALSAKDVKLATQQNAGPGALGTYVPAENKVLVAKDVADSDPELAELVVVHELARALEGEPARRPRLFRDDEAAAIALQEGTAALTETEYAKRHLGATDPVEPNVADVRLRSAGTEAPPLMQVLSAFPLRSGADYVDALYGNGQWDAVDAAHRETPVTTREILHPDTRGEGEVPPPTPKLDGVLGSGWKQTADASLGELDTIALLRAGVSEDEAREAADGWRAGHMEVWGKGAQAQSCPPPCRKGSASVLVWRLESPAETEELARAARRSLQRAANAKPEGGRGFTIEDGGAAIVRRGRFVALAFAPDPPSAGTMAEEALKG